MKPYMSPAEQAERLAEFNRRNAIEAAQAEQSRAAGGSTARPPYLDKLAERAAVLRKLAAIRNPWALEARIARTELGHMDPELLQMLPSGVDLDLRAALAGGASFETRALGATARASLGDKGFGSVFYAAAVKASPLMRLAAQVPLSSVQDHDFGAVVTNPSAGNIVADGGSATSADPTFGGTILYPHKYERLLTMSNEMASDSFFDVEGFIANTLAPLIAFDAEEDFWGGNGTTGLSGQPDGLLAALSTTTAAGATTVLLDDVAAVLAALPAATISSGTVSILASPAAYWQLRRQTLGTSAAGGLAIPATAGLELFGYPVYLTPALADPATGTKPIVVGDISRSYLVGQMPLKVDVDFTGTWDTDQTRVRVTMRCDGRTLDTTNARALVMA